jgi:carboxypeptidase A2
VIPATERDRDVIRYIVDLDYQIDVWRTGRDKSDIFVPPEVLDDVKGFLERNGVEYHVINDHVDSDILAEEARLLKKPRAFDVNSFNTFDDIVSELNSMVARCPTGLTCDLYSIGQTAGGRDIWTLKISKEGEIRQGVWFDATIHAREWLATATHLKITTRLIDEYETNDDARRFLDTYDWYLTPVANPDGYVYTWESDRLWRKNRSPNDGSVCIGTDLNRNFAESWGVAGSSNLPCSSTYHGASAGSELETQAMQSEAVRLGPTLATSIHTHTYGQYWLIPWGSYSADGTTCNIADDDDEMMLVANAVADAIENTYGTDWLRGNSCNTIYPASGITMDYFKGVAGVKYTATPELRGDGFVVDASEIEPSFNEVWNGFLALFDTLP